MVYLNGPQMTQWVQSFVNDSHKLANLREQY